MTFAEYLEHRAASDSGADSFLARSDRTTLDRTFWADLMRLFRMEGRDRPYILEARNLHEDYSRANSTIEAKKWRAEHKPVEKSE